MLVAWAGATLPSLVRAARALGYSGLEGIVGVPGHVGGGVAMNAGGRWGSTLRLVGNASSLEDLDEVLGAVVNPVVFPPVGAHAGGTGVTDQGGRFSVSIEDVPQLHRCDLAHPGL